MASWYVDLANRTQKSEELEDSVSLRNPSLHVVFILFFFGINFVAEDDMSVSSDFFSVACPFVSAGLNCCGLQRAK